MDRTGGCSSLPVMLASPLTHAFFPLNCALLLCTDAEIAMDFLLSSLVAYDHDVLVTLLLIAHRLRFDRTFLIALLGLSLHFQEELDIRLVDNLTKRLDFSLFGGTRTVASRWFDPFNCHKIVLITLAVFVVVLSITQPYLVSTLCSLLCRKA